MSIEEIVIVGPGLRRTTCSEAVPLAVSFVAIPAINLTETMVIRGDAKLRVDCAEIRDWLVLNVLELSADEAPLEL